MGVKFTVSGNWDSSEKWLRKLERGDFFQGLEALAKQGVTALQNATPVDSGLAAASWDYEIKRGRSGLSISWTNHNVENGFPVVVMLQYGYATGTGGYVRGRDFINPAIKPIFDKISEHVWKAVKP